MSYLEISAFVLGVMLGGLASWNNASISIGILIGSGISRRRIAALLVSLSVFVGILLEGYNMTEAAQNLVKINGNVTLVVNVTVLSILAVLVYLTYIGIPTSLTQMSVMAVIAIGLLTNSEINVGYLETIFVAWIVTPIISLLISAAVYLALDKKLRRSKLNWIKILRYLRVLLLFSSLYLAYVVGANLLGFLYSLISPVYNPSPSNMLLYGVIGMMGVGFSGEAIAINIGFRTTRLGLLAALITFFSSSLVVHVSTWIHIPVSITQCVLGGAFGISLAKGSLRMGAPKKMLRNWLLAPIFTFVLAFIIYKLIS